MRVLLHLVPIAVAMITLWMLVEPVRIGQISILSALAAITVAFLAGYIAIVVVIGALTGTPPSQWFAMLKQLIRGRSET